MMQPVGFTSAASALIQTASGGASTYFMPPIDPGNVDTQVSVPTGVTAYVNFAPGVQVGPDVPGCLIVKGGYPALLTANAAAIAAAAQGGRVLAHCGSTPGSAIPFPVTELAAPVNDVSTKFHQATAAILRTTQEVGEQAQALSVSITEAMQVYLCLAAKVSEIKGPSTDEIKAAIETATEAQVAVRLFSASFAQWCKAMDRALHVSNDFRISTSAGVVGGPHVH